MGNEPELPESDQTREPPEEPPPFQPDPALFANQDRRGEPNEDEVRGATGREER